VLFTNRTSYTGFPVVTKSMTLSDLERRYSPSEAFVSAKSSSFTEVSQLSRQHVKLAGANVAQRLVCGDIREVSPERERQSEALHVDGKNVTDTVCRICEITTRYEQSRFVKVRISSPHLLFIKNSCQTQLCTKFIHMVTNVSTFAKSHQYKFL